MKRALGLLGVIVLAFLAMRLMAARVAPSGGVVDEAYRFRLLQPGPDWRLLTGDDATEVVDALAVAVDDARGNWCAINAEPYAGDVDLAAGQHGTARAWVVGHLHARRVENRVLFTRDGFLFQLWCWGSGADVEPFAAAVMLLGGTVEGRVRAVKAPDRRGVGWVVKDGRFYSTVHGFAVTPPTGWRLLLGGELPAGAHVGLAGPGATLVVTVWGDRAPPPTTMPPTVEASYLGAPFALRRLEPDERSARSNDPVKGLARRGGKLHEIAVTEAPGVLLDVRPALAAFEVHSAPVEVEGPDPRDALSRTASIRDGVYRDFALGLRWTLPAGFDARLGPDRLLLRSAATGLRVELVPASDAVGEECTTAQVEGRFGMTPLHSCRVGPARARTWGPRPFDMGALVTDASKVPEVWAAGLFIDHRCGFRVKLPGDGWQLEDRTLPAIADRVRHVVFTRGAAEVHAFAAFGSADVHADVFAREMTRDLVRTLGAPKPELASKTAGLRFYAVATRGVAASEIEWRPDP